MLTQTNRQPSLDQADCGNRGRRERNVLRSNMGLGRQRGLAREVSCGCCLSRRNALSGFAAMAASALAPGAPALAQSPPAPAARPTGIIDVHRHVVPPGYQVDRARTWLNERSTIERQLEDMDKSGVALAVTSISGLAFE